MTDPGTWSGSAAGTGQDTGFGRAAASSPWGGGVGMPVPPGDAGRAQCASLILRTHAWLERAVPQMPETNGLVPVVTRAVQLYRTGDYAECYAVMNGVGQGIALAAALAPVVPPW
ncbi:hypothetical protein [Streptomyces sp. AF1A]|jgi:hypothetical protein|uniref:hypothetical protein n=1 Tax=Streptomyces sp. AF1A TaxID=3394350 RepID=UPI0039BC28FC